MLFYEGGGKLFFIIQLSISKQKWKKMEKNGKMKKNGKKWKNPISNSLISGT